MFQSFSERHFIQCFSRSAVYACMTRGYGKQLYTELLGYMQDWTKAQVTRLATIPDQQFVEQYRETLQQARHVLADRIVLCFTYMDTAYVKSKLNSDLKTEVVKRLASLVSEQLLERMMRLLSAHKAERDILSEGCNC